MDITVVKMRDVLYYNTIFHGLNLGNTSLQLTP